MEHNSATASAGDTKLGCASRNPHHACTTQSNVRQEVFTEVQQRIRNRLRAHAKLTVPHILVLLAGLAYLTTTFMALSTGLADISGHLASRLKVTRLESLVQRTTKHREEILYDQLDKILNTRLSSSFMETYEDCLTRGLLVVDHHLFGQGFQYADIRVQTIDWTVENCGRLHYTPQLSQPTVQQTALTHWAQATYQAHRIAEKTLTVLTHQTTLFRMWLFKHTGVRFLETPELTQIEGPLSDGVASPGRTQLPFGFELQCNESSSCRLVYATNPGTSNDKPKVSLDSVAKSMRKAHDLRKVYTCIHMIQNIMGNFVSCLVALEVVCLGAYFMYTMIYPATARFFLTRFSAADNEEAQRAVRMLSRYRTKEEGCLARCVTVQPPIMAIHALAVSLQGIHEGLNLGILLAMIGVQMLIQFFIPMVNVPNIPDICRAFKGLCLVLHGAWTDPDICAYIIHDGKTVLSTESPASPSHLLFPLASPRIAPTVPLQHGNDGNGPDLVQENQNNVASDDSGNQSDFVQGDHNHDTPNDSESDLEMDTEGYVDLAGGITPTIAEDSD
jgi:hypothetical protein